MKLDFYSRKGVRHVCPIVVSIFLSVFKKDFLNYVTMKWMGRNGKRRSESRREKGNRKTWAKPKWKIFNNSFQHICLHRHGEESGGVLFMLSLLQPQSNGVKTFVLCAVKENVWKGFEHFPKSLLKFGKISQDVFSYLFRMAFGKVLVKSIEKCIWVLGENHPAL